MKQNPVIIIMAKVPGSGLVKTRLKPYLNDSQCVEISICFLKDTVIKASKITENIIVAFTPDDGRKEIEKLVSENIILTKQIGENLGERMQSAIEFADRKGFSPITVIGTDSPNFPADHLQQSINLIEQRQAKIVIGASEDGGYYLIGFENPVNGIFENIEWSSEKTLAQTIENAKNIFGVAPLQIASWYDVDTSKDLKKLFFEYSENTDFKMIAPNTANWLENNKNLFISDI